jgi:hypothetical protein
MIVRFRTCVIPGVLVGTITVGGDSTKTVVSDDAFGEGGRIWGAGEGRLYFVGIFWVGTAH